MKTQKVPFSTLRVAHPTIIGATTTLYRTVCSAEEEARLAQIQKTAEKSAQHLKDVLLEAARAQS